MKQYVKPVVSVILLRTEERLAASGCACSGTDASGHTMYISNNT